jgi:hypothetical protein
MDIVARVVVLDTKGQPRDIDLRLEAYDLSQSAWRSVEEILSTFHVSPKISRDAGRHELSFTVPMAGYLQLFASTVEIRLVSLSDSGADNASHVIYAAASITSDTSRLELDFATVLYLGRELGFYPAQEKKDRLFCSAVSLADGNAKVAEAQRRFYANPLATRETDVELDKLRQQAAQLASDKAVVERALALCQADRAKAAETVAGLEAKLTAANQALSTAAADRDGLTKQLAACAGDKAAALSQSELLRSQLDAAASELRRVIEASQKTESDLAGCRTSAQSLQQKLAESAAALEACGQARAQSDQKAAASELARIAAADKASMLQEERHLLVTQLADYGRQIADKQGYVEDLKLQYVTATAAATSAVQQLDLLREQQRNEVTTDVVFQNLTRGLGNATLQLAAENIPYRIGAAAFTLKTFVSGGGGKMYLPDAAHLGDYPSMSEVSFQLMADDAPAAAASGAITVPDVSGLTETAAIQVLGSLSLKAQKAIETVTNQPEKHGRALLQVPKAGASVAKGDTVLVVYGAEKGNQNGQ